MLKASGAGLTGDPPPCFSEPASCLPLFSLPGPLAAPGAPVALASLGRLFALLFDAGLFEEIAAAHLADDACLFHFLAETFQQALKTFPFMNLDLCQLTSLLLYPVCQLKNSRSEERRVGKECRS